MRNRKMLYGYIIRSGELAIEPKEKVVIKRIFSSYIEGLSYQGIADMLNEDKIAYSSESREWNKHKVKRLLENPRYMGENEYPAVITAETFEQVQMIIRSKLQTGVSKQERPAVKLVDKLCCEECGKTLKRLGCNRPKPGVIYLKCPECGKLFNIADETLLTAIEQQRASQESNLAIAGQVNAPTMEVMRLENELNRALEKPDEPAMVIQLIQQGIAARYARCEQQSETIKLQVVRIDINKEEKITVHFE